MAPFTFDTTPPIRFVAGLLVRLGELAAALLGPHGFVQRADSAPCPAFQHQTAPEKYGEIAQILFLDLAGADNRASGFCDALKALANRCGLPPRLRDVGIDRELLPTMAADAMNRTRLLMNNPRDLTRADALRIYEAAW